MNFSDQIYLLVNRKYSDISGSLHFPKFHVRSVVRESAGYSDHNGSITLGARISDGHRLENNV